MQHYTLELTAHKRPETLERLLRVIRHRGFEVLSLNAENHGDTLRLTASLQSSRAVELLIHQLVKLPDVIEVK